MPRNYSRVPIGRKLALLDPERFRAHLRRASLVVELYETDDPDQTVLARGMAFGGGGADGSDSCDC